METPSHEAHLRTQYQELQRRYTTLTNRVKALDTDIGRELDSERKLTLEDRLLALAGEREQVATDLARIERELAMPGIAAPASAAPTPGPTALDVGLSAQERASLERQLAELRENLRLVEERKSEFVEETEVPLQLIKNERRLRERVAEIEARLATR
jgi:hypothetical protein